MAVPDEPVGWIVPAGVLAVEGAFEFGNAVTPWIEAALPSDDPQERACLQLLLREIEGPARTAAEREARAALNVVTWKCDDPVRSWRYVGR